MDATGTVGSFETAGFWVDVIFDPEQAEMKLLLLQRPGIKEVFFGSEGKVFVTFDPCTVTLAKLKDVLEKNGFGVSVYR